MDQKYIILSVIAVIAVFVIYVVFFQNTKQNFTSAPRFYPEKEVTLLKLMILYGRVIDHPDAPKLRAYIDSIYTTNDMMGFGFKLLQYATELDKKLGTSFSENKKKL